MVRNHAFYETLHPIIKVAIKEGSIFGNYEIRLVPKAGAHTDMCHIGIRGIITSLFLCLFKLLGNFLYVHVNVIKKLQYMPSFLLNILSHLVVSSSSSLLLSLSEVHYIRPHHLKPLVKSWQKKKKLTGVNEWNVMSITIAIFSFHFKLGLV